MQQDFDVPNDQPGVALARQIGATVRFVRKQLHLTQTQLAQPTYSTAFLSSLERGRIRPSLQALSILAQRLDVPLSFLLTGDPSGYEEARMMGYAYEDDGVDSSYEVGIFQTTALVLQGAFEEALQHLRSMKAENMDTILAFHWHLLFGRAHLGLGALEEAAVRFRTALALGQLMGGDVYIELARNQQGLAFAAMHRYMLALGDHLKCYEAVDQGLISDPAFALEVLGNVGSDYLAMGDFAQARRFFEQALTRYGNSSGGDGGLAGLYMDASLLAKLNGMPILAGEYAARSLIAYEQGEGWKLAVVLRLQCGRAMESLGDVVGAERSYEEARSIEAQHNRDRQ
jgi:HTH-type transcriptional regulator, quorum sensing regulator NprR